MFEGAIQNLTTEEYIIMLTLASMIILFFVHLPITVFSKSKSLFNDFFTKW